MRLNELLDLHLAEVDFATGRKVRETHFKPGRDSSGRLTESDQLGAFDKRVFCRRPPQHFTIRTYSLPVTGSLSMPLPSCAFLTTASQPYRDSSPMTVGQGSC